MARKHQARVELILAIKSIMLPQQIPESRTWQDALFALATGRAGKQADPLLVGFLAAEVLAEAVLRAVWAAEGLPDFPSASQLGH